MSIEVWDYRFWKVVFGHRRGPMQILMAQPQRWVEKTCRTAIIFFFFLEYCSAEVLAVLETHGASPNLHTGVALYLSFPQIQQKLVDVTARLVSITGRVSLSFSDLDPSTNAIKVLEPSHFYASVQAILVHRYVHSREHVLKKTLTVTLAKHPICLIRTFWGCDWL